MAKTNNTGAINALKGYEAQFRYSSLRILDATPEEAEFAPEGKFEDLDIYTPTGALKEIIQIKALAGNLQLNHILAKDRASFLRRVLEVYKAGHAPIMTLVSFGPVSSEVSELASGNISPSLKKKLTAHGFSGREIVLLGKSFRCLEVSEAEVTAAIFAKLKSMQIYVDVEEAANLLMYSMHNAAVGQEVYTTASLTNRLFSIGKFLNSLENYHSTFGTLIRPISAYSDNQDVQHLQQDFFQGISARFAHVVAGVDVRRTEKIELLDERFKTANVVFIHGASGQGKSTLAYRYLHETCDVNAAFEVTIPDDPKQLYALINTLDGVAQNIATPLTFYIDIAPASDNWVDVIRQLSSQHHLRFLVTIREENWNAAYVQDKFAFADIELSLEASEAAKIYEALDSVQPDLKFTSFDEAWEAFGGHGPLLEFVYLITQGETLRSRLREQVDRIKSDGSLLSKEKIKLLKFVTLSDCFQARMDYRKVGRFLNLSDLRLITERMQNEYLIRVTTGTQYITGLHPIRSAILKDLLFDPHLDDQIEYALESLPLIDSSTVTIFLRHMFRYLHVNPDPVLHYLKGKPPKNWTFCQGVLKALLWKGVNDYIQRNEVILKDIVAEYPEAWIGMVDVDIAKAVDAPQAMFAFFTGQQKQRAEFIQSQLTARELIFEYASRWLDSLPSLSLPIPSEHEANALSYFLFWLHRLSIELKVTISVDEILAAMQQMSLSAVSPLLYGIRHSTSLAPHFEKGKEPFLARFRKEYQVIRMEETPDSIHCTFFFKPEQYQTKANDSSPAHSRTIEVIDHLRLVYTEKTQFHATGYGHEVKDNPEAPGDTNKNINKTYLPLVPLVEINRWFINLVRYPTRPDDWHAYNKLLIERRKFQVAVLREQVNALCASHKIKNWSPLIEFTNSFQKKHWQVLASAHRPVYPKLVADEWGLTGDRPARKLDNSDTDENNKTAGRKTDAEHRSVLAHQRYELFRGHYDQYDTATENYLAQSVSFIQDRFLRAMNQEPGNRDFTTTCLYHLFKAYETVEDFHTALNMHFEKFTRREILKALEEEEKQTLTALCTLFRHFVESGTFLEQENPLRFALGKAREIETTFKNNITDVLKKQSKLLNGTITHRWDERRLIITVDSRSLPSAQLAPQILYMNIAKLGLPQRSSTKSAVIRKLISSIHVIQMVKGKLLHEQWSTFTADDILRLKENYSGTFQNIPEKYRHGLSSWTTHAKAFESINNLLVAAVAIRTDLYHMASLADFQDTEPDQGAENYIKPYVEQLGQRITENSKTVQHLFFHHCTAQGIDVDESIDPPVGLSESQPEEPAAQPERYTKADALLYIQKMDEMMTSIWSLYALVADKITNDELASHER